MPARLMPGGLHPLGEPRLGTRADGCCIIDIDGEGGEAERAALEAEHGAAPETMTIGTPSGGRHLIFSGSLPSTAARLAPHVDTRGVGGYGILPPSRLEPYVKGGDTMPGGSYTWLSQEGLEPALVPSWVATLLGQHEAKKLAAPRGSRPTLRI